MSPSERRHLSVYLDSNDIQALRACPLHETRGGWLRNLAIEAAARTGPLPAPCPPGPGPREKLSVSLPEPVARGLERRCGSLPALLRALLREATRRGGGPVEPANERTDPGEKPASQLEYVVARWDTPEGLKLRDWLAEHREAKARRAEPADALVCAKEWTWQERQVLRRAIEGGEAAWLVIGVDRAGKVPGCEDPEQVRADLEAIAATSDEPWRLSAFQFVGPRHLCWIMVSVKPRPARRGGRNRL